VKAEHRTKFFQAESHESSLSWLRRSKIYPKRIYSFFMSRRLLPSRAAALNVVKAEHRTKCCVSFCEACPNAALETQNVTFLQCGPIEYQRLLLWGGWAFFAGVDVI
jgi:hypothetical protein